MKEEFLLVDGYNVIFDWEDLRSLAAQNLDAARMKLQDILSNYQGFHRDHTILVFDAYKVKGNTGSVQKYHNIEIIFTKEAETADQYIERVTTDMVKIGKVRVVTSDQIEQIIILGKGATRVSAREFKIEVEEMNRIIKEEHLDKLAPKRNFLINNLSPEMANLLEEMRLKETKE